MNSFKSAFEEKLTDKQITLENKKYLGSELTHKAIEKIDEENTKEGGKVNGEKKETRGRKKATSK